MTTAESSTAGLQANNQAMADADTTYAVVDMSKKRKNRTLPGNDTAESAAETPCMATDASATALYATTCGQIQEKKTSIFQARNCEISEMLGK